MSATDPSDSLPFAFDEFASWYSQFGRTTLEPSRLTFTRILSEIINGLEVEHGRGRYKLPASRLKDPARLWAKMHLPKYAGRIVTVDDIPDVIDDLVGLRIVCTNQSDVAHLQLTLHGLTTFPASEERHNFGLAVEAESHRDYIIEPKPSGYRAIHVNLLTEVPQTFGTVTVRGELQVRSLLQDGWGELTHEDTYKPGQDVPELASVLSRRMGELLATVDAIAEDIRDELSRNSQAQVQGDTPFPTIRPETDQEDEEPGGSIAPLIVKKEAQRLVLELSSPAPLAQIAARLRATFGSTTLKGWLGYKTFKSFIADAVPEAILIPVGPTYIVPPGIEPTETWPQSLRDAIRSVSSGDNAASESDGTY